VYLLAALVFAGFTSCRRAPPPPSATPVLAQTVELITASETLTLTGEIRAQVESDLSFRVGGRITERNVNVGDRVVADEVLAKIDPNEQQASLTAAGADVQAADAKLKDASSTFDRQKLLLSSSILLSRKTPPSRRPRPRWIGSKASSSVTTISITGHLTSARAPCGLFCRSTCKCRIRTTDS
jgi:multidrug efflux pump subunit AcrA (membrane-fusion protein)